MTPMFESAKDRMATSLRNGILRVMAGLCGLLAGLTGFGFLTAAGYLALRTSMGAIAATLVVAGVFLLLAAVFGLIATTRKPAPAPPPETPYADIASLAAFTAAYVLARKLKGRDQP